MGLENDLRYAWRRLWAAPGFTVIAILVLALGIGANTAMFSLVDAILLKPLPFVHPNQLVAMYETESAPGAYPLSGPDFPDWKAQAKLFSDMTLYRGYGSLNLTGGGEAQRLASTQAATNFFSLLGARPELGRTFLPHDDRNVAVLSHQLWESRFGGSPAIVGRSITLDGQATTVLGVMPVSFHLGTQRVDVWVPLRMDAKTLGQRGNHSFSAIGRLKPGVTLAAAQAEISAIAARLAHQYPDANGDTGARLYLLRDRLVRAPQRASLWTLLAVVGLVLLIACANIANLLLARALGRQKEFSIRVALGARPAQLVRQLLAESVLLALVGAAVGAALAWLAVRTVVALPSFTLPQFNRVGVNGAVLGFTVALAVVCGVLFGLAPALQLARPRLSDELSGAGALAGGRRRWLSDGLIVAEVACSLVLVAAAVLFVQSFLRLRASTLGFEPQNLVSAAVATPDGYSAGKYLAFKQQLLSRLQALPGVEAAALTSELPLEGGNNGYITLEGRTQIEKALVEWTRISPSYFETMRIRLVEGTGFTSADQPAWNEMARQFWLANAPPTAAQQRELAELNLAVVVNQAFARHFFPGQDAIGKRFRQGGDGPWMTVKGIAADVPIFDLGATAPMAQAYFPVPVGSFVVVRSKLPETTVAAGVRRVVAGLDATVPVYNIRTLDQVVDGSVAAESLQEELVLGFAGLALLLAAAGLYGVMAYSVAARTREIGVRMALGASRGQVVGHVLGRGLRLAGAGIGIGIAVALASGRLIASQLYHTAPDSWTTLAVAALILLGASVLASYVPARRAAAVDPNQALRQG